MRTPPVLVVGDIDRGGVFASLYGTVALLPESDRALIRGFVINKFRGDPRSSIRGSRCSLERTGVPTLGVLPYLDLSRLPAEDAVEWDSLGRKADEQTLIDIAVMRPATRGKSRRVPAAGLRARRLGALHRRPERAGSPRSDHHPRYQVHRRGPRVAPRTWPRRRHPAKRAEGTPVLGICGGFQMLGTRVIDEGGVEAHAAVDALGLLPMTTTFAPEKVTRRVHSRVVSANVLWAPDDVVPPEGDGEPARLGTCALDAYEIHMGRTQRLVRGDAHPAAFSMKFESTEGSDGACSPDGLVVGTYMHGLLENASLRRAMLARLTARKGVALPSTPALASVDAAIDTLADAVVAHLDVDAIFAMTGLPAMSTI